MKTDGNWDFVNDIVTKHVGFEVFPSMPPKDIFDKAIDLLYKTKVLSKDQRTFIIGMSVIAYG